MKRNTIWILGGSGECFFFFVSFFFPFRWFVLSFSFILLVFWFFPPFPCLHVAELLCCFFLYCSCLSELSTLFALIMHEWLPTYSHNIWRWLFSHPTYSLRSYMFFPYLLYPKGMVGEGRSVWAVLDDLRSWDFITSPVQGSLQVIRTQYHSLLCFELLSVSPVPPFLLFLSQEKKRRGFR